MYMKVRATITLNLLGYFLYSAKFELEEKLLQTPSRLVQHFVILNYSSVGQVQLFSKFRRAFCQYWRMDKVLKQMR